MKAKRRRARTARTASIANEHNSSGQSPQTLQQALLHGAWRLPAWARYGSALIALVLVSLFSLWVSLPEKKKEQAIDFLVRLDTRADILGRSTDVLPRLTPRASSAALLSIEDLRSRLVELHTTTGVIQIELLPDVAPNHVRNFLRLAEGGLYDGTRFHRVIPGFVILGGDPNTTSDDRTRWGLGGAIGTLRAEFSNTPHNRGTVSMARSINANSGSSQFFICLGRQPALDRKYTVFGKVIGGMDVVDRIAAGARDSNDQPYDPIAIEKANVRAK